MLARTEALNDLKSKQSKSLKALMIGKVEALRAMQVDSTEYVAQVIEIQKLHVQWVEYQKELAQVKKT